MNRMTRNLQNRFGQVGFVLGFLVLTGCSRIFILESPTLSNLFTTSLGENGSSISCRRPCPFRRNKIVLDHYGLNGLRYVLSFLDGFSGMWISRELTDGSFLPRQRSRKYISRHDQSCWVSLCYGLCSASWNNGEYPCVNPRPQAFHAF